MGIRGRYGTRSSWVCTWHLIKQERTTVKETFENHSMQPSIVTSTTTTTNNKEKSDRLLLLLLNLNPLDKSERPSHNARTIIIQEQDWLVPSICRRRWQCACCISIRVERRKCQCVCYHFQRPLSAHGFETAKQERGTGDLWWQHKRTERKKRKETS